MDTRRSDWEEDKYITSDHVRSMDLKKYNNVLNSGKWYTKYTQDDHILALVEVDQNLAD